MDDYFGFVYIWMDKKRKMFYIGSHSGRFTDNYIGSSIWFRRAYKKRPTDFRRKILSVVKEKSKTILHEKETYWLQMIKISELGIKYYNFKRVASGGNTLEFYTPEQLIIYRQKLKQSANTGEKHYKSRKFVCYGTVYNTLKEAKISLGFNPQKRLSQRRYKEFYYLDEGPLTELEILNEIERKERIKQQMIEKRKIGISKLTKQQQHNKAKKAALTRAKTYPYIGHKISQSLKNKPGRPVSIDGIIYSKGRIAAEKLNINYGTVKSRLRKLSFPTWFYLDDLTKNSNTN